MDETDWIAADINFQLVNARLDPKLDIADSHTISEVMAGSRMR